MTTAASAASTTARASPTTAGRPGVLGRRDVPPAGVKAQFDFVSGGAEESCEELAKSPPAVVVDDFYLDAFFKADRPEIGTYFEICFPGFQPRQPVQAEVGRPDRQFRSSTATDFGGKDEVVFLGWTSFPGDPVGIYTVTAVQGSRRATGTFTVSPASVPRVVVDPPTGSANAGPSRPGTSFRVHVAGFPPNADAPLYVYVLEEDKAGGTQGHMRYLTRISVRTDGSGQGMDTLVTSRNDPPGLYCIIAGAANREPDYVNECNGWGLNDFRLET